MSGQTLAEALPCTARCYQGSRGCHSDACISIRADVANRVTAWLEERLAGAREDVATNVALTFGGRHDPEAHGGDGDNWRPEADAALDVVREALGIEVRA